jgi:hypothetical protein
MRIKQQIWYLFLRKLNKWSTQNYKKWPTAATGILTAVRGEDEIGGEEGEEINHNLIGHFRAQDRVHLEEADENGRVLEIEAGERSPEVLVENVVLLV